MNKRNNDEYLTINQLKLRLTQMGVPFTPSLQKRDYYLSLYNRAMRDQSSTQQFDFSAPPKNQTSGYTSAAISQQSQAQQPFQMIMSKQNLYQYKQYMENQYQKQQFFQQQSSSSGSIERINANENIDPNDMEEIQSPQKSQGFMSKITKSVKNSLKKLATPSSSKKNQQLQEYDQNYQQESQENYYNQLQENKNFNNQIDQLLSQENLQQQQSASLFKNVKNSIKKALAGLSQTEEADEAKEIQMEEQLTQQQAIFYKNEEEQEQQQNDRKSIQQQSSQQKQMSQNSQKNEEESSQQIMQNQIDQNNNTINLNKIQENYNKRNSIGESIVKFFIGDKENNKEQQFQQQSQLQKQEQDYYTPSKQSVQKQQQQKISSVKQSKNIKFVENNYEQNSQQYIQQQQLQTQYNQQQYQNTQDQFYPRLISTPNVQYNQDYNFKEQFNFNNYNQNQNFFNDRNLSTQSTNENLYTQNTQFMKNQDQLIMIRRRKLSKKRLFIVAVGFLLILVAYNQMFGQGFALKYSSYFSDYDKKINTITSNYNPFKDQYRQLAEQEFKIILQQLQGDQIMDVQTIKSNLEKQYKQSNAKIIFDLIDQLRLESAKIATKGSKWEYVK